MNVSWITRNFEDGIFKNEHPDTADRPVVDPIEHSAPRIDQLENPVERILTFIAKYPLELRPRG
jgi:hypothetical protein